MDWSLVMLKGTVRCPFWSAPAAPAFANRCSPLITSSAGKCLPLIVSPANGCSPLAMLTASRSPPPCARLPATAMHHQAGHGRGRVASCGAAMLGPVGGGLGHTGHQCTAPEIIRQWAAPLVILKRIVQHSYTRPRYRHALPCRPWSTQGCELWSAYVLGGLGVPNTPPFGNPRLSHPFNWPFPQGYFAPGQSQNDAFGCV